MTEEQYLSLCEKYLKGDCTPEEESLIKNYQDKHGLISDKWDETIMGNQDRIRSLLRDKLQKSISKRTATVINIYKWHLAAAATILLFTIIGVYFVRPTFVKSTSYATNHPRETKAGIQPGSNRAILTLTNGNKIVLDSAENGVLTKEGNAAISKSGSGLLIKGDGGNDNSLNANTLNTITIPRGGKYDIVLSDGTKVSLNSTSSLTFPTTFTGTERKVTLTGEAYFEVAKNKAMPFKINVENKQVVEVLGTHFNINAYADEGNITTTLLEGSVKIKYKNKYTLIKPGQMAVNDLSRSLTVKPADVDEVMAWKNGMFIFNNENITSIMKKVSRWYDVDVVFKGDMDNINFTGNYSRSKSLSTLLKNIELIEKVHFVIEGRRVTIITK